MGAILTAAVSFWNAQRREAAQGAQELLGLGGVGAHHIHHLQAAQPLHVPHHRSIMAQPLHYRGIRTTS